MINNYYKGKPCFVNGKVVRIIGESKSGSWFQAGTKSFFTIPVVATPHGTILTTGLAYIMELTDEGVSLLKSLEEDAKEKGVALYGGKLPEMFPTHQPETIS